MTKAANRKKRVAHRGRPRDEDADREPNGRKRRSLHPKPQEDARVVAIEARMRQFGVSRDIAGHEKAGTILGLLWLQRKLSEPLREAGERIAEYHAEMIKATQAPDSLASGGNGGGGDLASEGYIDWAVGAVLNWELAKNWLLSRHALNTFERIVLGRVYPTTGELSQLRDGLAYCASRMGLDRAA